MKVITYLHIISLLIVSGCSMLLTIFTDVSLLKFITGLAVFILMVSLFFRTSGYLRIVFSSFIVVSFLISTFYNLTFENILDALNSYTIFIALFVCTPQIRFPIEAGKYLEKIIPLINQMPRKLLSPMTVIINFTLSSFLNIAGMRVTGQYFSKTAKEFPLTYGPILSRSFNLAAIWTPYFAAFSVAISFSNSSSTAIVFIGLLFSLSVITIWILIICLKEKRGIKLRNIFSKQDLFNIGKVMLFFILLVTSVVLLSHFTNLNVIFIISILSIFFSFTWCVILRKINHYLQLLKKFISYELTSIREEAFLFISTGFFTNTLLQLGWDVTLPNLKGNSPFIVFLFIVLFNITAVVLTLFGIHHLVTITFLSTIINWQEFGIVSVVYGMTILLTWCLCSMISPFSASNLVASRIVNKDTINIGLKSNSWFGLYILLGGAVYLTIINEIYLFWN